MFLYFPRLASGCNTYPTLKLDPDKVRLNHCAEHLVRSHFIAHRQTTRAQQTDCSTRTTKMIGNYTLTTVVFVTRVLANLTTIIMLLLAYIFLSFMGRTYLAYLGRFVSGRRLEKFGKISK